MKIPHCMSTQHPDNASTPFFASSSVLAGEDEIREAYYAFSHLGCDEQMWDVEGKEIDTYVVKKLLTYYPEYFHENVLGEDLRITLRVPNPTVEKAEAKILLETLESIPRSYDAARLFYANDVPPIFEVILPMTTSARCIDRVYHYYADHIIGRQNTRFCDDDVTIAEWIGEFLPSRIQVIPLFEDVQSMLNADRIVEDYLSDKDVEDQRVFLARSDTAMNFGLVSAALANKIALMNLDRLAERIGVRIHPILGMGSAPFRGGLSPRTAERVGREYPSVVTFTIQSAFKFDYPVDEVRAACEHLKSRVIGHAAPIDVERAQSIMERYSKVYRRSIAELAPHINRMAKHVPARRARKLHVGLFGYARELDGITLPRAISFTCSLYALGLPPELIAFDALSDDDLSFIHDAYPSFRAKIEEALKFADLEGPLMTDSLREALGRFVGEPQTHEEHLSVVRRIRNDLESGNTQQIGNHILSTALMRRFLG
ncbi:MAG TPA: phosphoenolpyruvate carboxylase [Deltaproteobacteria bacterium]|nr:phosphoenolpyruvate carboxylase [Deltaproteobacteria bacterium]HOM28353.1 phosphoenolpyruvate carboxylase [Deltaproteobacteria bacterium]HPP81820.1 phosphoenolpyruvate carboxylase [Deltaproteobacteria bacterium]